MKVSVVLADDEPLILKGLTKLIPWDSLHMEIAGYAYDGKELLDAIHTLKPDIVISDISMPHYSGIDIIKEVKRLQLPVKIIFISAYQEFSYARDAVAFGAVDYLVKPVKKAELEQVIAKAVSQIREENEEDKRRSKLQQLERKKEDDEVGNWLEQLTAGSLSPASGAFASLAERLPGPRYSVGMVRIDPEGNDNERWPIQTRKLVDFAINNVVQESLTAYGKGCLFMKNGHHVFVISQSDEASQLMLGEAVKVNIARYLKLVVSVGLGGPVETLQELRLSSQQAERALDMSYFAGLNLVIPYRKPEPQKDLENKWFTLQSNIIEALTAGNWEKALSGMKALMEVIKTATVGNRQLAVSTCFSSVLAIVQEVKKSDVPMSAWGFDIQHLQSRLEHYHTYASMAEGIYDMLQELYNRIGDQSVSREQTLMDRIAAYIRDNYQSDISLESAAAVAFMNPYYFSSFFKKHMKRNFKQYVTDLRMEQAVSLLTHTDLMVYEIADKVGYRNARHFSDMFKKQTGMLPQEFKQSIRQ
ncbi:response regulator [Paenibacillus sp. CAU 1782]